jgi:ABC-type transport system substrate-binding protein
MKPAWLKLFGPLVLCSSLTGHAQSIECNDAGAKAVSVQLTADEKLPYDPTTTGFAHITFFNAVLGRLIHLNSNLTVQPGLLENAYWDFKTERYILSIRPGSRFHNGRAVVAEDLEFSLVRFFFSGKRVDPVAFLKHIQGVEQLKPGMKYKPWSVSGIQKIDNRTIGVSLSSPNPAFLYSLSEGWISLVPKEAFSDDLVTWKTSPVGAGPYRIESVDGHNVRVCHVGDSGSAPKAIEFVSDVDARADIVGFISSDYALKSLKKVYGSGPIGFTGLFFNAQNELGSNAHFRKAVASVIHRQEIIGENTDFSPLSELLTTNFYGRLQRSEKHDLALAKQEIAKVPEEFLGKPLKAYWYSGRTAVTKGERAILNAISRQLASIGVQLVFEPSIHPTFSDKDTEAVLRIDDRGTAFSDPLIIFRAFEKPAFLSPFFPKENSRLKTLISYAANSKSLDVKAGAIFELSKYFDANTIVVPLYERKTVYWVDPAKIADLGVQTGITFDVNRVRTTGSRGAKE